MSNQGSAYGTNNAQPPVLGVSSMGPAILFEWAALLPLAVYLASNGHVHEIVGRISLLGSIKVSFFPPIGVLYRIASLLENGPDFLDRANSIGELRRTVWDANWGSIFTCANGATSDILSEASLLGVRVSEIPQLQLIPNTSSVSKMRATSSGKYSIINEQTESRYRRNQLLHVIDCSYTQKSEEKSKVPSSFWNWKGFFDLVEIILLLLTPGLGALAILFGLYGTAVCIFVTFSFHFLCRFVQIHRPPGYLYNNEGPAAGGCMLTALHENASTWFLYTGSREIVDSLLNKPMIDSISSPLGSTLPALFRFLGVLQLVAVTYVASQKGWDGIALLALIFTSTLLDHLIYNKNRLALCWLQKEKVKLLGYSFRLGTRSAVIGAVQVLKQTPNTSWMDEILAPCSRRDAWLALLAGEGNAHTLEQGLVQKDKDWLLLQVNQTEVAVNIILDAMRQEPDHTTV